ncbi:tricarballylate dehydrogenase [Roseivivax sp. THAF40]|uniref:TIGR03862 family flavoprotein n=1 Tax=unclassified Roseivivax TaxID=2639302 RepID=UPI0012680252|nr:MULTISPECIES: TIGR03862 family flavoprotein [unclassified Roseivivax]QFS84459.1 tricarballylate dehydrogenase [Roseivivax sp. THAF197b]QFT48287.1 tricarballylate dehydrogenase [Roseivivax sp. THAF40]
MTNCDALVVGGGPAGLMAAEALLDAGRRVLLVDQKPSLARKFLMAGKSGLNLTKREDAAIFRAAYGAASDWLAPMLDALPPSGVEAWATALDQEVFAGSTGRVFPKAMKASPLLRAWLARLGAKGLETHTRWRWTGGTAPFRFDTPEGAQEITPRVAVLTLGGASWRRLGSDGDWAGWLGSDGVTLTPFAPANVGINVSWSDHMKRHFGAPLKNISLSAGDLTSRGEAVVTRTGLEGGGLYPLSPALRDGAALQIDLTPDLDAATLTRRLSRPRGKDSRTNWLRKTLKLPPAAQALLMECARPLPDDPAALAHRVKALNIPHDGLRPMDEAISTAGGIAREALDQGLMLRARPGVFAAGEMLDWEAPTGGYLLTACLATGLWAGRHAAAWPREDQPRAAAR